MTFYEITEQDKELIKIALKTLENNFDDGVYNHTVGAAIRCKNLLGRSSGRFYFFTFHSSLFTKSVREDF